MIDAEKWTALYADVIPYSMNYTMRLEAGEENGLLVYLEDDSCVVTLDFGAVYAVSVMDEGLLLNHSLWDFDGHGGGILYSVNNGKYAETVKQSLGADLFDAYGLKQYNVITMNYVVHILAKDDPAICVQKKTEPSERSSGETLREISELLHELKNNYGKYIGRKSLHDLSVFISGYECAMNWMENRWPLFNGAFQRFVEEVVNWDGPMYHWSKILQTERTDSEAFDFFYELLRDFEEA